jgi:alpha-1,2-mannosyltransferase
MSQTTPQRLPSPVYLVVGGAASLYAWAVVISTVHYPGAIGLNYNAFGTDYMVFHTAISLALHGDVATLYDPDRFTALLNRLFHGYLSENLEYRPWIYPPSFLPLLLPFSLMGFVLSYVLFQLVTAAAMMGGVRAAIAQTWPRQIGTRKLADWVGFAVLACPAASISFVMGQCSFLIVALLAAGVGLLDRRPLLAGLMFGLLSFKPQFFLMVPVVLLARSAWRASFMAAATVLVMAAASLILFGPGIWTGWFEAIARTTSDADPRWFLLGRLWGESVYTCAWLLGASPSVAQAAQTGAIVLAGAAVWHTFRMQIESAPRAAVLLAAALLAAPHSGYYDLLLLVAAGGLFLSHLGSRATSRDWLLGLLVWLAPMFGLPVLLAPGRFCPVLTVTLLARIMWDARAPRPIGQVA